MTYRNIDRPFAVRVASADVVASGEQGKRPWALTDEAKLLSSPLAAGEAAAEAAAAAAVVACAAAPALASPLLLAPLEFALLDCEIAALTGMSNEPDVIEACDTLQLRLTVPGVPRGASSSPAPLCRRASSSTTR